jgi:hypothetical protein
MGSMLKFDSDRRELVRERRQARMERKAQRREDRGRKRTEATPVPTASATSTLSATQRAADERVRDDVDRIVEQALDRHDQRATTVGSTVAPTAPTAPITPDIAARRPAPRARPVRGIPTSPAMLETRSPDADEQLTVGGGAEDRAPRVSRRERDLAAFRERRQHAADTAREEARARIRRAGELASVADALAALAHPASAPWTAEHEQLERALENGRFSEVGAQARRALWAIARDAARTSPRAPHDPDLALAACVAYAIIARAPRSALRSAHRTRPTPRVRPVARRAFWR